MKKVCTIFLLIITAIIYSNPRIPTFTINEFGFNEKGWVIELKSYDYSSDFWVQIISNTDTSVYFKIQAVENSEYYLVSNDSLNNDFYINPLGDNITVRDSNNWCIVFFSFGSEENGIQSIVPKVNQSFSVWHKPLGKTFFYLDNSPTFGLPNDSANATGIVQGIIKDTLGHPIPNLKVYYDYETYYGGGDIYVTTNDSGYFSINHFSEYLTLRFKRKYFYDDKVNVQIYPDSTINLSVVIKTDILSCVESDYEPAGFTLEQNYPNPFNPTTKIKYSIPTSPQPSPYQGEGARVRLIVYDILGNEVATLVNEEQPAGEYEVEFSLNDGKNYSLPSGIYFYQLSTSGGVESFVETKKMCVIK